MRTKSKTQRQCPCGFDGYNVGSANHPWSPNEAYCPECLHSYGPVTRDEDNWNVLVNGPINWK